MVIRTINQSELNSARKIWETCFDDKSSFVEWYFTHRINPYDIMGFFTEPEGQLLADLHLAPYELKLRNKTFPTAYIIGLATKPEYRRKGIAKKLLRHSLKALADRGRFITILMPFNVEFYTRLGWGVIAGRKMLDFTSQNGQGLSAILRNPGKGLPGVVRTFAKSPPEIEDLGGIYEDWTTAFNGCLLRTSRDWQGLLFDHYLDEGEVKLLLNNQGKAEGYALTLEAYAREKKKITVREIAYKTLDSGRKLLQEILGSEWSELNWSAPVKEALLESLWPAWSINPNQQTLYTVDTSTEPFILGRITDIRGFIPLLPCPDRSFHLHVEVYDPLLEDNCGVFRLYSTGDGRMGIEPSTAEPDLRCQINALTEIIAGRPPAADSRWQTTGNSQEGLWARKKRSLTLLQEIFPPAVNYINDFF